METRPVSWRASRWRRAVSELTPSRSGISTRAKQPELKGSTVRRSGSAPASAPPPSPPRPAPRGRTADPPPRPPLPPGEEDPPPLAPPLAGGPPNRLERDPLAPRRRRADLRARQHPYSG